MLYRRIFIEKASTTWMVLSISIILVLPLLIGIGLYVKANPLFEYMSLGDLICSSTWLPNEKEFGFLPFIHGSYL
jgi:phosphate transport system permease protein